MNQRERQQLDRHITGNYGEDQYREDFESLPSTPPAAQEHAVKASVALSYVPCILFRLDQDTANMFAAVMQAMRDGGYEDGYRDGKRYERNRSE